MVRGLKTVDKKAGDTTEPFLQFYYGKLVDIWEHEDTTFWTSVNVFLIAESILFVAVFSAVEFVEDLLLVVCISLVGFGVSLAWLLVGNRWRLALLLTNAQCRYLERELFAERIKKGSDVTKFVPMYFVANRAAFHGASDKTEELIHQHCKEAIFNEVTVRENRLGSFSFNLIVTTFLPVLFLLVWLTAFSACLGVRLSPKDGVFASIVTVISAFFLAASSFVLINSSAKRRTGDISMQKGEAVETEHVITAVLDEQIRWNMAFLGLGLLALGYTWYSLSLSGNSGFNWYSYWPAIAGGLLLLTGFWWGPFVAKRIRARRG